MRPQFWTRLGRLTYAALPVAAVLALSAGCNIQIGGGIEAKETWSRTYTPKPGGTLIVKESNGTIRVNVSDEDKIEVTATKISKASTEEAAKADLKEYEIAEKATPDLVEIDSSTRALQVMLH